MKKKFNCYNCCCRCSRNNRLGAIILTGVLAIIFQILLIIITNFSFKRINNIKNIIFGETPIYNLTFGIYNQDNNLKYIESFYEWQGRRKTKTVKKGKKTTTKNIVLEKPKNITKIYGNHFIYKNDNRNYFDYLNNYSVAEDEDCQSDYKKCGILNSEGRILCLKNEEECPLNGFAISNIKNDEKYLTYDYKEVFDSLNMVRYYFYYTNSNINGKIITNFKLSYGLPCMFSIEKSWISILESEKEINPTCRTSVNGKLSDDRYTQVEGGEISLKSLYNDNNIGEGLNINTDNIVELYTRNYIHIDENCSEKFFKDIENEDNYFSKIEILKKILSFFTTILIILLIVYSCLIFCYNFQFYWFLIIFPILGIIANILELIFINKKIITFNCSDEGYNCKIDDILRSDYSNNRSALFVMCISTMISLIINLIFCISMKVARNPIQTVNYNNYGPGVIPNEANIASQYPQVVPNLNAFGQNLPNYGQPIPASSLEYNNLQAQNLAYGPKPMDYLNQNPSQNLNNINNLQNN